MALKRLLIVDDDKEMSHMLAQHLGKEGFIVYTASTELQIREAISRGRIDLILLDIMLGEENGLDICRQLRAEQDVAIILVSALSADSHRISGYAVGADDYIAKPFNPDLLIARVKAVLRRNQRSSSLHYRRNTSSFQFNGWTYDGKRSEVTAPTGIQVALSQKETRLLCVFLANPHVVLKREEIAAAMDITREDSGVSDHSSRALDVLVGRLRHKLNDDPKDPKIIRTERGVGYLFAIDVTRCDF
ncbi:MAG: response regulator transcription factor [Paracoccaceae bacterium]